MSRLLKALKAGIEAFRMVYRGWTVDEYKKYDKDDYYVEASIWYDIGHPWRLLYGKTASTGWNVSRKGYTYTKLCKTPFEATIFADKLIQKG